jgi:hypothetical protein
MQASGGRCAIISEAPRPRPASIAGVDWRFLQVPTTNGILPDSQTSMSQHMPQLPPRALPLEAYAVICGVVVVQARVSQDPDLRLLCIQRTSVVSRRVFRELSGF